MKFIVLASGSKGNSTYIETKKTKVLIDAGISFKQVRTRLDNKGIILKELDGVFITHEHHDHISGVNVLLKNIDTNLYLTKPTYENMYFKIKNNINKNCLVFIENEKKIVIKDLTITPISVYHDALDPVGYILECEGKRLVYITDTGYFPESKYKLILNADSYIIEANHEPDLLLSSRRPWNLKKRILDDNGHLSNEDCAIILCNVIGEKTKSIILAHQSGECNEPNIGKLKIQEIFNQYNKKFSDYFIAYAEQDISTNIIKI